jgi:hypothetical protein
VIIGVVAAMLVGLAGATSAAVVVTLNSAPDKKVNFNDVHSPQLWQDAVNYNGK